MREIKSRAWDKKNKKMIYDFAITSDGRPFILQEIAGGGITTIWGDPLSLDCIPMLYTNRKDKNNRNICEGDIVELYTPAEGIIGRYIVRWDEVAARFYLEGNWKIDTNEIWEHSQSWLTVIGNIYENPELIGR